MSASGDDAGQFAGALNTVSYPPVRVLSSRLRGLCTPLLAKK